MRKLILAAFITIASAVGSFAQVPNMGASMVPNTALPTGVVQSNLTASASPTASNDSTQGYAVGSLWQNSATGQIWIARSVAASAAVWTQIELSDHPGYIVGNWYNLPGNSVSTAALGTIKAYPYYIKERITLNALGVRVSVTNTGNVQAAIYAANLATGRPTGAALASTASMSTASAVNVTAATSAQVEPGLYWLATNCDNATATFVGQSAQAFIMGSTGIGSATQANALGNQVGLTGVTVAQSFGAWPDLTSASFTEYMGTMPIVQFKIGSVP